MQPCQSLERISDCAGETALTRVLNKGNTYQYVFHKPNPLMQGFYLMLVIGGFALFVQFGLPLLPNRRLGYFHVVFPFVFVLWVLLTFVAASNSPPGYVTAKNAALLERVYKYDGFLFVRQECSTCKTPKVARSKHCRMMGRCVEKYDHYCPWINNTVGGLNFRYFLLFVLSTAVFLVYGTYVIYNLLMFIIERDRLWDVKFMNTGTNELVKANWMIIFQFMMAHHGMLMFLLVLCAIMGITLVAFFIYQLYLIKNGTTSNEAQKWADVKDFYASKKWEREQAARGPDFPSDAELLRDTSAPLAERMVKEFPSKPPTNIYNLGFWENMKDVIWPASLEMKRVWLKIQEGKEKAGAAQQANKASEASSSSAGQTPSSATSTPSVASKDKRPTGRGKSGSKKKA